MATKKVVEEQVVVDEIAMGEIVFCLWGASPLIMNRFSQKARQELLFPSRQENRASLEQTLKHDPVAEFKGALYLNRDKTRPAAIHIPNGAFHGALASVAIDIPGAARTQIERLTRVVDVNIDLFGVPHLFCSMVRNSDMRRTPDVRTRPIFPEWACQVTIRYVKNILTERTIANLFGAAGKIIGVGDWRGQKGGPYGSWELVRDNDARWHRVVETQGSEAQVAALAQPIFFDEDTTELLTWFEEEVKNREMTHQLGGIKVIETHGGDRKGHDENFGPRKPRRKNGDAQVSA